MSVDLDELNDLFSKPSDIVVETEPRKCRRHEWQLIVEHGIRSGGYRCARCSAIRDEERSRRNRNNRKRGNAAEPIAAKVVGGRAVGPLKLPWDVEMPGYARLQVRKYATPESLRKIAAELARIGSGAEMPGYIWIQPGRGGERLIVFRLDDFAERHGIPTEDAA